MTNGPAGSGSPGDVAGKLRELAAREPGPVPAISAYLDTRWSDEHQRDRVRVFLKNEIRKAAAMAAGQLDDDLAWVAAEGSRLVDGQVHPETLGVAMFTGASAHRREMLCLAVPFANSFAVDDVPRLRPLVQALGEGPRAVLLFLDGERARVAVLTPRGAADEIVLETADVVGHHRRGGWALLMQSRYQRHIQDHRRRHFDAVAHALADLGGHYDVRSIVLAGERRNLAVFRAHLPPRLADQVVGEVPGARYEPTSALAERARALMHDRRIEEAGSALDAVLVDAEAGGRATRGLDATLEAVNRDAVDRLYLLRSYQETGRVCLVCHALQRENDVVCRWCGGAARVRELGEAIVRRVLASGGDVATIEAHHDLQRAGGLAASLRYPPRR
jgi:peptide subunit release factor 1 (eRF1)